MKRTWYFPPCWNMTNHLRSAQNGQDWLKIWKRGFSSNITWLWFVFIHFFYFLSHSCLPNWSKPIHISLQMSSSALLGHKINLGGVKVFDRNRTLPCDEQFYLFHTLCLNIVMSFKPYPYKPKNVGIQWSFDVELSGLPLIPASLKPKHLTDTPIHVTSACESVGLGMVWINDGLQFRESESPH